MTESHLPALDDLMAKFRERMLAEQTHVDPTPEQLAAVDERMTQVREAIVSRHDTIAQLTRQPEPIASPTGLRRLFPGLR